MPLFLSSKETYVMFSFTKEFCRLSLCSKFLNNLGCSWHHNFETNPFYFKSGDLPKEYLELCI